MNAVRVEILEQRSLSPENQKIFFLITVNQARADVLYKVELADPEFNEEVFLYFLFTGISER